MPKIQHRWWDLTSAFLFSAAIITAVLRLRAAEWTRDTGEIETITVVAIIIGLALGASRFKGWMAVIYGAIFTVISIPWMMAAALKGGFPWLERVEILYSRVSYSFGQFVANQPVRDSILFGLSMALLFWLATLAGAYFLSRRGRPWVSLLLLGLTVFVIEYYDPDLPNHLVYPALYVLFCLLLLARLHFIRSQHSWVDQNVTLDTEAGFHLGRSALIIGVVLVLVAWNLPGILNFFSSTQSFRKSIDEAWVGVRDRLGNLVINLESPVSTNQEFYDSNLSLGLGSTLSDDLIFTAETNPKDLKDARIYWRARSYNVYSDGEWTSSEATESDISYSLMPLTYPAWVERNEAVFLIVPNMLSMRNIYAPSEPIFVGRKSTITGTTVDGYTDVNAIVPEEPIHSGETFRIRSYIGSHTIAQLRHAGADPDWVTENYLQLPEDLSNRIKSLAQELTAGEETRYDKVMAITNYLRTTINYQAVIPAPPEGHDPIDWFLFDHKAGFCNYFASAEVLMLRSLGIPARLAVGYASGDHVEGSGLFEIHGRDSHAWPEVYFEGSGWVQFEPTGSQPGTSLFPGVDPDLQKTLQAQRTPARRQTSVSGDWEDEATPPVRTPIVTKTVPTPVVEETPVDYSWLLISVLVLISAGVLWLVWRKVSQMIGRRPLPTLVENLLERSHVHAPGWLKSWSNYARLSTMERLYQRIGLMMILLRIPINPAQTAQERIGLLVATLPFAEESAYYFLEQYQLATYSTHSADIKKARISIRVLWNLTLRKLWKRITRTENIRP